MLPEKIFELSLAYREKAYAPYSQFQVVSALSRKNAPPIFGVNVENASFGATICAERNAVTTFITEDGNVDEVDFLLLLTDTDPVATPCGLCLQVLAEFFSEDFPIYLANLKGIQKKMILSDFLPHGFKAENLKKK